jgi:hypothetical protein
MDGIRFRWLLLTALFLAAGGCKSPLPDLSGKLPWVGDDKDKETIFQQPVKMVVIWSPAMYTQPGQAPTRGFGGRIYFYNSKEEAIPVDGKLVVYAFDDTHKQTASQVADKRFAFTAEQFKKHFSPTKIGASYSIWIPWDPVGSPQADISVLPVFSNTGGGMLTGQQSRNVLPGPETPKTETRREQWVDWPAPHSGAVSPATSTNGDSVQTHTIGLPQSTAARLAASRDLPRQVNTSASGTDRGGAPSTANGPVSTASFSAPTTDSRAWGPVVPRHQYRPGPGLSTRSLPSSPQAPSSAAPQPVAGLLPTPPSHAGQPPRLPGLPPGVPPSSGQVIYRDVFEAAP